MNLSGRFGALCLITIAVSLIDIPGAVRAQAPGTIVTVAGGGVGDGVQATAAYLGFPNGAFVDKDGNLYITDTFNHRIRKVDTEGVITTVAGDGYINPLNGSGRYRGDGGPATEASLNEPRAAWVDSLGNLFIADAANYSVRKVDTNGTITTVAGTGLQGSFGDNGPATQARFRYVSGVFGDKAGNLYISDGHNNRIRKVTPDGTVSTFAGGGSFNEQLGDGGPATAAFLAFPANLYVDGAGNLYIADLQNHRIRKVTPGGTISTVAGDGSIETLYYPAGVFVDSTGAVYITDQYHHRILKVAAGVPTIIAGTGTLGFSGDGGPATLATLAYPIGVYGDAAGNLYIGDSNTLRIRKVDPDGNISTVAGGGAGDGGPATQAFVNHPGDAVVDRMGNLYIADFFNHRIRKVDTEGVITTVAGDGYINPENGRGRYGGDGGPATAASLNYPAGIAVDGSGNLYIADQVNQRIRKVDTEGIITTIAGNGASFSSSFGIRGYFGGDGGPATQAGLSVPTGVGVDEAGNVYIADWFNHRVRKVDTEGIITTVAGDGSGTGFPTAAFSGDGGPATRARLSGPTGVDVDGDGNLYIADSRNQRIRKVAPDGVITTVAGDGVAFPDNEYGFVGHFSGDGGPATAAGLSLPTVVRIDKGGNLYISDLRNSLIRKVSASGTITTVAGNRLEGASGDGGPATAASLYRPGGVGVDRAGNVYIADEFNHRVRKVIGSGSQAILDASATRLALGRVEIGASKDTTITMTNPGADTLHVTAITASHPVFSTQLAAFDLPPGHSVIDTVRITPATVGPLKGYLIVESNAAFSPDTLRLSVVGIPPLQALPADTSTLAYQTADNTQVTIRFQSGTVAGHTLAFESFGAERPPEAQAVPGFSKPLLYFSITSSIPSSTDFSVEITLTYTNQQLADAGITDELSLTVAAYDSTGKTWTLTATTVDTAANIATFTTTHFSTWALASVGPTGIETPAAPQVPKTFALRQNAPNPFNPATQIAYEVPQSAHITLTIYNILGQEVVRLVDEQKPPGRYVATWNGRNARGSGVASGVYLYRLTSSTGFSQTKRMTLLR